MTASGTSSGRSTSTTSDRRACCSACCPRCAPAASGHIVYVSTMGVNFPPLRWSAYIASKVAFEAWLAGVAPEIRADGVTTTSLQLQLVRSPMLGPFRMWNYIPGMSSERGGRDRRPRDRRAAARRSRPHGRASSGAATSLAQAPVERALSRYAGASQSRRVAPVHRRRSLPSAPSPESCDRSARTASPAPCSRSSASARRPPPSPARPPRCIPAARPSSTTSAR